MGLFGLGSKRNPPPQPIASRPKPVGDAATTPFPSTPRPSVSRQADVEVCELNLDDDEFSTTFGSGTTQFDDIADADHDPWTSRLRLD